MEPNPRTPVYDHSQHRLYKSPLHHDKDEFYQTFARNKHPLRAVEMERQSLRVMGPEGGHLSQDPHPPTLMKKPDTALRKTQHFLTSPTNFNNKFGPKGAVEPTRETVHAEYLGSFNQTAMHHLNRGQVRKRITEKPRFYQAEEGKGYKLAAATPYGTSDSVPFAQAVKTFSPMATEQNKTFIQPGIANTRKVRLCLDGTAMSSMASAKGM
jgi:hypothetical protein